MRKSFEFCALFLITAFSMSLSLPFTPTETNTILSSFKNLSPLSPTQSSSLETIIQDTAHTNYKEWQQTSLDADKLLLALTTPNFDAVFNRVTTEGNYNGALQNKPPHPWAVLVTGCNGIRKTTALHQPWFGEALAASLKSADPTAVPTGANSFYRQLDHIIASLCNEQFKELYQNQMQMPTQTVASYSASKAHIFSRYRKLSEMVGVSFLKKAIGDGVNVLAETSGKDKASWRYIDEFFPPSTKYKKLAIHFSINDLSFAKESVDERMKKEIRAGIGVLENNGSAKDIVNVNLGGPYGSEVLEGVERESEKVWGEVKNDKEFCENGWEFAELEIIGDSDSGNWKCRVGEKEWAFV